MTTSASTSHARHSRWGDEIVRRVQEQEIRRRITHNRVRKAGIRLLREARVRAGVPALLPDYAKALLGSALGFWIIAWVLSHALHAKPLYTLLTFGFFYSAQAAYYTYRLSVDPTFRIPRCGCAGAGRDDSEVVLRSRQSTMWRIPNAALGVVTYSVLAVLAFQGHLAVATVVAALAVAASAYLGYVMVVRLSALCSTCVNIAAVNLMLLWQLVR